MKKIKVKLTKSLINQKETHKRTVKALGLRKINSENILPDNPQIRGMINKVKHLIEWEEIEE